MQTTRGEGKGKGRGDRCRYAGWLSPRGAGPARDWKEGAAGFLYSYPVRMIVHLLLFM